MIQEINKNRVLLEVIPEIHRIVTLQKKKPRKMITGRVHLVGTLVESCRPGQIVTFYNEGIQVKEGRIHFRIVNEIAVVAIQHDETTQGADAQKEADQADARAKDNTGQD